MDRIECTEWCTPPHHDPWCGLDAKSFKKRNLSIEINPDSILGKCLILLSTKNHAALAARNPDLAAILGIKKPEMTCGCGGPVVCNWCGERK